jgi:flagellar protein FliJ
MAGFKFRLQSILDYRASLVDRARQEVGAARARLRQEEERLKRLRMGVRASLDALALAQGGGALDLDEVARLQAGVEVLERRIEEQHLVVAGARHEAELAQARLVGLSKDAKALEKLRERQQEEWAADTARREQAELSELASLRHRWMQAAR